VRDGWIEELNLRVHEASAKSFVAGCALNFKSTPPDNIVVAHHTIAVDHRILTPQSPSVVD
jgi:hypothetical protein